MSRLWLKIIKRHRIDRQQTAPCVWEDKDASLRELAKDMDLPMPIWLNKHENEWKQYGRTAFLPEHFIEDVDFEQMEIEFLDDTDTKRKSKDPRNQF
ncbi:hypothetical protein LJC33_06485 [Eubacteriales bacterium OttesenSCG-928-N13]|nr:hypothetical protein [Eubacteriales bacterium OttesenSCG-928-N13]